MAVYDLMIASRSEKATQFFREALLRGRDGQTRLDSSRRRPAAGELVPGSSVELAPAGLGAPAAPLLEEERDPLILAAVA